MHRHRLSILVLLALLLAPASILAQGGGSPHTLVLYGFATSVNGDGAYGQATGEVDVDFSSLLDSLEMAAMVRYRAEGDRWAFVLDGMFAGLGGSSDGPPHTEVDLDLLVFQADAAYRFSERAEVLVGVRYASVGTVLDLAGGGPGEGVHIDRTISLLDPVVGLRALAPVGGKWSVQAQGDVGGGVDMDLTWQAMANLGYRPSDGVSFWLGYRALAMDFDEGGPSQRVAMDIVMHGPVIAAAFHF